MEDDNSEKNIKNLMFAFNATGLAVDLQTTELILEVIKRFQQCGTQYSIEDVIKIQESLNDKYGK